MDTKQKYLIDKTSRHGQSGFTLLEVMVAVVVLVLGVLGAAAMTVTAIRNSQQSSSRSTAVALAYEVGDLIRSYPAQIGSFIGAKTASSPGTLTTACFSTGCTEANLALNDLYVWAKKVQLTLPSGNAAICRDNGTSSGASTPTTPNCDNAATAPIVIKIWWTEKSGDGSIVDTSLSTYKPTLIITLRPT